jgi:hypothetical protein
MEHIFYDTTQEKLYFLVRKGCKETTGHLQRTASNQERKNRKFERYVPVHPFGVQGILS